MKAAKNSLHLLNAIVLFGNALVEIIDAYITAACKHTLQGCSYLFSVIVSATIANLSAIATEIIVTRNL